MYVHCFPYSAERTELLARKTRLEKGLKEMREVGVA